MPPPPNRRFVLIALVAPLLIGPTVFTVVGLASGMGVAGFPHGLELVIAPLFFAPVAMGIAGLVMGVFASRGPRGDAPEVP